MSDNDAHKNQLTGEEAQAFAARMLGDAHLLGRKGTGAEARTSAVEKCFDHADTPVDLADKPLLKTVAESKPAGKGNAPATPGPKPKPGGPK